VTAVAAPDALRAKIKARVQAAGTSFYWAMRLLPEARRDAMFAVYAFCREVDDIADSNDAAAVKRAGLQRWRDEIYSVFGREGRPRTDLGVILDEISVTYRMNLKDFLDVIDGMAMDADGPIRAPSLAELDLYCDRVASAVGRLSVRIFGADSPAGDRVAASLGRALQLTNILRDIAEDASLGRLYLPRELLRKHGIETTEPDSVLRHPALPQVCDDLAVIAERHFIEAAAAMKECPRRAMRPAAVMGAVYRALLRRLRQAQWRDPARPVKVPDTTKLWLALRHGLV
jgi:presqualene diphosphate synthase